jgi:cellulose synthase/poly-beta-1,6-N-acetylglucosamine synthase-like glycosyltransferase
VIPAWNERAVICQTVRSVLASDAGGFPIVVVDDGSTDGTADLLRATFADEPRVRVLVQTNAGKWAALNRGFASVEAEIVVALDADTVFRPDTVRLLAAHFEDERVGAVAGNARVGNPRNLLTRWQALEYVTSQNLDRRALAWLDCITVVPGAVGAWRRAAILDVGGFADDTLAEDADLTLRLLRAGWSVAYEERAIALTEAPETVRAFLKQRFRWMFGTLQAAWKHRAALFRRRQPALGWVALPNVFVFGELFPLISPVMDLLLFASAVHALAGLVQHPQLPVDEGFQRALWFYALFVVIDAVTAALAFAFERGADRRLLWWLLPQRFFYRQLMYTIAIQSLMTALRGPRVGWGKLERTASVPRA